MATTNNKSTLKIQKNCDMEELRGLKVSIYGDCLDENETIAINIPTRKVKGEQRYHPMVLELKKRISDCGYIVEYINRNEPKYYRNIRANIKREESFAIRKIGKALQLNFEG